MAAPAMSSGVVILMAQTVSRRTASMSVWNKYGEDGLLVIDEAHHAAARGWGRAVQQWPGRIISMTATPWRLSKKEGFDLPDASCIVLARPTKSLALYLQSESQYHARAKPLGRNRRITVSPPAQLLQVKSTRFQR